MISGFLEDKVYQARGAIGLLPSRRSGGNGVKTPEIQGRAANGKTAIPSSREARINVLWRGIDFGAQGDD